ncbi:hypothetical protein, partial [Mycoplasmopsis bovis]|uniref:hypothetical protein n=1 Tax=Mycoplasmopsis bovis TaxID=28903 RepID=UPI003D2914DF
QNGWLFNSEALNAWIYSSITTWLELFTTLLKLSSELGVLILLAYLIIMLFHSSVNFLSVTIFVAVFTNPLEQSETLLYLEPYVNYRYSSNSVST